MEENERVKEETEKDGKEQGKGIDDEDKRDEAKGRRIYVEKEIKEV